MLLFMLLVSLAQPHQVHDTYHPLEPQSMAQQSRYGNQGDDEQEEHMIADEGIMLERAPEATITEYVQGAQPQKETRKQPAFWNQPLMNDDRTEETFGKKWKEQEEKAAGLGKAQ